MDEVVQVYGDTNTKQRTRVYKVPANESAENAAFIELTQRAWVAPNTELVRYICCFCDT